jgi:hypothetical protein
MGMQFSKAIPYSALSAEMGGDIKIPLSFQSEKSRGWQPEKRDFFKFA